MTPEPHSATVPQARERGVDAPLPAGSVTFLYSDLEGSTRLLADLGDAYPPVLARHYALLRAACHQGAEIGAMGDSLLVAFSSADAALQAARDAQDSLAAARWPRDARVRVRIGIHTGRPRMRGGVYWGPDVHYAARVASAAHGGQVLVSAATAELVPGAELVDLGEHRLKDFPVPRRLLQLGQQRHPPPRTLDPLRSNLPSSTQTMIGRGEEHDQLLELLGSGEARLVTITGAGGSGKTRLALAVAEALLDELADGAFFIPLAEVAAAPDAADAIAAPFGIPVQPGEDPADSIVAALGERELLLVLDNFEHLLDAGPLIATLLARAPSLRILVTSQAPLRVRGEHVVWLRPLAVPDRDDLESLHAAPAGRLLLDRAREAVPSFEPTLQNAADLARLCRALDGLPLALELAAARLSVLAAGELLVRLQSGIDALGRGARDLPRRQRGLRAALEWTHALLEADEAALFRRMGVFAGAVSLERIEQVCGEDLDALEALAHLVDLSLVRHVSDGRFVLHGAVRAYARERLDEAGEREPLRRRHGEAFARAADEWGRRFLLDQVAVQTAVIGDQADLGDALSWAATEDPRCFAQLAGGAGMALLFTGRLGHWTSEIEGALPGRELDPEARAWLLLAGALAAFQRADAPLAMGRLAEASAGADAAGDAWLSCLMDTCSLVVQVLTEENGEQARDHQARLRGRVGELGDRSLAMLIEGLEPYVTGYCEGRVEEAAPQLALLMNDPGRTDFAARTAVYCWPDGLVASGRNAEALVAYTVALRTARERNEPPHMAYHLEGIAIALSRLGRHEEAIEACGWAESVRQTAGPAVSPWWNGLVAGALEQTRAALAAGVADDAYARGRALTLDGAVSAALRQHELPSFALSHSAPNAKRSRER